MVLQARALDIITVIIYLAGLIGLGAYCARRGSSADNYFAGHRNYPGWVMALSMLGSVVSSTTFLALPAAAFVLDWRQLGVNLVVPIVAILAVVVFIPFFRRGGLTSAFEYLGDRFGVPARLYGTISFVILQLLRVAQVLFLVSLPLQFLTGVPLEWVIIGGGVFVGVYTLAGGMETIVWAGVIQALIMLFGGVMCLLFVVGKLPGGLTQVIEVGGANGKFSLGSMQWNLSERTFWTVIILGTINWLHIYSSEQTVVQRYVSAKSTREARKATLMFSGIAVPMWTMFFFIGTAIWVFFRVFPDPAAAGLQPDQMLPYFVLKHIPAGLAGLVIAAVIAAALSSLDSGINSIATVVVIDVIKPHLAKGRGDKYYLRVARWVATGSIVVMIAGAYVFNRIEKESVNDVSLIIFSVLGGCLTGLYLVGFFTTRVDGFSVNVALALAIAFNIYLCAGLLGALPPAWTIGIHSYWVTALVNAAFVVLALGISLARRPNKRDLSGLTVWTQKPQK